MDPEIFDIPLSFSLLTVELSPVGQDLLLTVRGGDKPHIGCVVLTEPRPSLKGDGSISCTSSVLSVPGHKDELLCRSLAEKAAVRYNRRVVCAGGFHVDNASGKQLAEILKKIHEFLFPAQA
ncbi:MAG: hypothetical protein IJT43_10765 [Stomatobaculum sp.]|nr:hypothetical protein [Stomatobaculum sp.]